jgi:hypothetical protein
MTHDEIDYLLERSKKYLGFGKILKVSVQQWPVKPFELIDYYVDFYMYDINLYASEKLSELSFEKFFETIEKGIFKSSINEEYLRWKKVELRNSKLNKILD